MAQLPLFPAEDDRPPQAARLAPLLRALAQEGVYFGTSSWKYEGWLGEIYSRDRYLAGGKFSQRKFEQACLKEYAETFPVVGGDFSFYMFPSASYWQRLFEESPRSLGFALKVPEEITVAVWPSHARYGARAGQANSSFLNAQVFTRLFAELLEPYGDRVAALIFEFGTFSKKVFATHTDFCSRLDGFLEALPPGFRYAVEIRNPGFLRSAYFDTLARYNAAHVFNSWTRAPEISAQLEMPGAYSADFTVVRALLRRGRSYEDAVKQFQPYKAVQEPNPLVREALKQIASRSRKVKQPAFLLVNNRLEGNAPGTIEAVVSSLDIA
jgi:uncharacterized protein YecE (DUF72 family)